MLIAETVTFKEFSDVDSAVSSCAILEGEDILDQVSQPQNSASDSNDNTPCSPEPSHEDLFPAFAVLSSAYTDPATLAEIQADLLARERKCVQKRLSSPQALKLI